MATDQLIARDAVIREAAFDQNYVNSEWFTLQRFDTALYPLILTNCRCCISRIPGDAGVLFHNSAGRPIYIEHLEAHDLWIEVGRNADPEEA
jgi:hypothetical protein